MGYAVVRQVQYRNFLYDGFLVKRKINRKLELAAEVFSHAQEGLAAPETQSSTLIDAGGYYHFTNPNFQLLFAYGHSIVGQTENYAYWGLYYTWGRADKKPGADTMLSKLLARNGFY